jgi:HAD superfamily hydrolase (TIGR01458 family)
VRDREDASPPFHTAASQERDAGAGHSDPQKLPGVSSPRLNLPAPLRALLVDLEGTVFQDGRLLPGAAEALATLDARAIPHAFVTNATSRPRSTIVRELSAMGLEIPAERVFTAPRAARAYLERRGLRRCHFLLRPALLEDFSGIEPEDDAPQAIVLGDLGEAMSFARLNRAFRLLLSGAELITLARNRYWRARDGYMLDVGAFTAALEYASGKPATLIGKPSPEFFGAALSCLGAPASWTAVIGDDLDSDVGGAQAAGMRGILVRTGKFREEDLQASRVRPDLVLDSLADLAAIL